MGFETMGEIITGVIGGSISLFVGISMARLLPKEWAGKSPETLVRENKVAIHLSDLAFVSGLFFAAYLYSNNVFARSDWRGGGIGFGLGCIGPMIILPIFSVIKGFKVGETFIAYSISEKMPPWLLFSIFTAGLIVLISSLVSIYA